MNNTRAAVNIYIFTQKKKPFSAPLPKHPARQVISILQMACAHLLYRYQTRRLILGIITIREITKTCRLTDLYVKIHNGCTQKLLLPPQQSGFTVLPTLSPQSVVILPFFVST